MLRHGICVKKTCPKANVSDFVQNKDRFIEDLEKCYNPQFNDVELIGKITKIRCEKDETIYPRSYFDIAFR